ncbi:MAG TPA: glycerol kinase GlpK [Gemmatimonadaceae bacterium]|nr:glycerol kinase GlpK [Gemmatimonadaceae bacterium]
MTSQQAVLAIDEGTTGITCLVVARDGRILARAYREITQHFPQPGWVEHDAEEIFAKTVAAAREAIDASRADVTALGITNQRETIVLWDRVTGKPVHRAIVWQDRRTAKRCEELAPKAGRIRALTGLVTDPYFSGTKLEWLLRETKHDPANLAAGTIDSWLIWKLTDGAVHATDHTNASRTMLYDIDAFQWSDELCAMLHVPRGILPEVRPSSGDFGTASAAHLGRAVPIRGVAGDQQSALFGQGCWAAGSAKNTYGTGAFLLQNTGSRRPEEVKGLLTTVACGSRGEPLYALEASIFIAGAAVQWLRDGLGIVARAEETEAMARSLATNDGVYFVPALVGLGAPWWEPDARGTIVGLTRGTTRAHLARAALEAMAYSTADVVDAMSRASGKTLDRLRVDGGATSNGWLMQFQADMLGVPVERPANVETTALGAAGLAGIAAGVWPTPEDFLQAQRFELFRPGAGAGDRAALRAGWARAVRATLHWAQSGG